MVFDNGSTDGAAQLLAAYGEKHPQINLFFNDTNLGFAGGVNAAAKLLDCDWLLIVGSDAIFTQGSLAALCEPLRQLNSKVAMLGPVTNEAGNAQKLFFPSNDYAHCLQIINQRVGAPTKQLTPVYQLGFFCVLVRKSVWNELDGLDLIYERGYYEDFDFSMRAKKSGYEFLMVEDSFVYHYGSASFKQSEDLKKLMKKNKKIFQMRHPDAELRHLRDDNLSVVRKYLSQLAFGVDGVNPDLLARINWRLEGLDTDVPRSPLKNWLWNRKVNVLKKQIRIWRNHNV